MKVKLWMVLFVVVSLFIVGNTVVLAQDAGKAADSKPSAEKAKPTAAKQEGKKIDLNSATLEELSKLPGIGKKKAQAIIDGRPYEKVEDLMKIKGIKEKKLAKIKDLIEVLPLKKSEDKPKEESKK